MSNKMKYLSLLVMLTFTVGQVQYAYSSYFCTMQKINLSPSQVAEGSDGNSCPAVCDGEIDAVPTHGHQLLAANCMQLRLAEKKVVDNFSVPEKAPSHFVPIAAIFPTGLSSIERATSVAIAVLPFASPPPDIPTLNSNLRI